MVGALGVVLAPEHGLGLFTMAAGRVEVPLSAAWAVSAVAGGMRTGPGDIALRDATVGGTWNAVNRADVVLQVSPALMVPLGTVPGNLGSLAPLSTRTFDPLLGLELVAGSGWLFASKLEARVPLYEGDDDVRQGPSTAFHALAARRLGGSLVLSAGGVGFWRMQGSDDAGQILDLAVTGMAVYHLADRWSLSGNLRVPLYGVPDPPYAVAVGLGATRVFGERRDATTH